MTCSAATNRLLCEGRGIKKGAFLIFTVILQFHSGDFLPDALSASDEQTAARKWPLATGVVVLPLRR
jgi:hypothetical protein